VARSSGALGQAALAAHWRSVVNLRRGAVPDSEADARFVYELTMGTAPSWRTPFARATLADALLVRGEIDEAIQVLGAPEAEEEAQDNPFYLDSRGRLHLARGDPRAALRDFLDCGGALGRRGGVDAPASFPWRSQAALALVRLGDRDRAREMASEELLLAQESQIPGVVAEALIALAIVEDGQPGMGRLRTALEILADSPRMLTRIRAMTALGAMLRRNRQPRKARAHLRAAMDLAYHHGAVALADEARQELIVAGGRPRRPATTGLAALTPSERRVAQLVAEGLTNRQIAHFLFIAPRTVTTHLTHIYQKIGITSRSELSALITDQDATASLRMAPTRADALPE
jgi:DNA-binding CsgD family transcriptional regulator